MKVKRNNQVAKVNSAFVWDLNSRGSAIMFDAAKKRIEEMIRDMRAQILELRAFPLLPDLYDDKQGGFCNFDRQTVDDKLEKLQGWLMEYEHVHAFILRAKATLLNYEVEKFGDEMAEYFKQKTAEKQ